MGPLAHLLKNRFYIGEITYRGEVHRGEHEPILSRDLFEAVQEKLAANAVARQVRLRSSAALLTGRKRYPRHFWARGYFCTTSGNITDEAILQYLKYHEPTGVSR